jgi:hypothetical protein
MTCVFARRMLACAVLLAADVSCMPPAPDGDFGSAKRAVEARQIQHPERSDTATPVDGTGATTAAEILENYHTNQKTEVQERRQDRQRDSGISEIGDE